MSHIIRCTVVLLLLAVISASAEGQKKIQCADGEHLEIDVKSIAIKYDGSSFAGTLSSLSVLSGRMEVGPKKLQEAAVATQQWDVFLKGLAEGYNKCAVSRQQYSEGLNRIYPRLKEDASGLEEIRKAISDGQKAEAKNLQSVLDSYYANLRRFAQIAGKDIILERIEALSEQVKSGQSEILEQQKTDTKGITDLIEAKFKELEARNTQAPLSTPTEVASQISELKQNLLANADEAEAAYNKGYALLERYRFREAVPYLQQALAAVPLPGFYLALGRAYRSIHDLSEAERILRKGLTVVEQRGDEKQESALADQLGQILQAKGDLEGALSNAQRALKIGEKVYGPDHPNVAFFANNIGQILKDKGDLEGALSYTQHALKIGDKVYGPDSPEVAISANNIGVIFQAKGDLEGALTYTQRALKIDEKVYGRDHPTVARDANNIGVIFLAKGDLEGALTYTQRALKIDEKVYGPDHPNVATDANNIGQILKDKGDLEGALTYAQRTLKILETSYGHDNPATKLALVNLQRIEQLRAKR